MKLTNWKKHQLLCFRVGKDWLEKSVLVDDKGEKKFYVNEKTAEIQVLKVGGKPHKCGSKFLIIKDERL